MGRKKVIRNEFNEIVQDLKLGESGYDHNCDNCDKYIGFLPGGGMDFSNDWNVPKGAIKYKDGGTAGFGSRALVFCSDGCKNEWISKKHPTKENNETEKEELISEGKYKCDHCNTHFDNKPKKKYTLWNVIYFLPKHLITLFILPIFFNKTYCSKECKKNASL